MADEGRHPGRPPSSFDVLPANSERTPWQAWPGTGLEGRDLGLSALSDGWLSAQHVRATGQDTARGEWHCYDLDVEFLYVLRGRLQLEDVAGHIHTLVAGSAFLQPAFCWHRDVTRTGDFEVVYVTSPSAPTRYDGLAAVLPDVAYESANRRGTYWHESPGAHRPGPSPRTEVTVRDVGTVAWPRGTVRFQVTRPRGRSPGPSPSAHTDASWSFVLAGECSPWPVGRPGVCLRPGDVMTTGGPAPIPIESCSEDYAVLEVRWDARPAG